ncbi:MAG: 2OG-Fe(II) oxygenase [Pseudomonadota bacterium]
MYFLNEKFIKSIPELTQRFANARPFKHIVVDGFFDEALANRLLGDFPEFCVGKSKDEFGRPSKKHTVTEVDKISSEYSTLNENLSSPEFLKLIEQITRIQNLIFDPSYYGGGTHDNHSGQGMYPHVDFNLLDIEGAGEVHRRINAIIYLNPVWEETWGGVLELHSNPWNPESNEVIKITPSWNKLVLFETNEYSWHGFQPVSSSLPEGVSRKSFALYLYTKERPELEVSPKHQTIYVPQLSLEKTPLPAKQLKELLKERAAMLDMLKGLYQKEKELNQQIKVREELLAQVAENRWLPSQGQLSDVLPIQGIHYDLFFGEYCELKFRATHRYSSMSLEIQLLTCIKDLSILLRIDGEPVETFGIQGSACLQIYYEFLAGETYAIALSCDRTVVPAEIGLGSDLRSISARYVLLRTH